MAELLSFKRDDRNLGSRSAANPSFSNFQAIYHDHVKMVWHMLRRLGIADRDLNDVTQNVFIVVHRKLHEFEGRSQLKTWIREICRRVAADYRRSAVVRREVPVAVAEEQKTSTEDAHRCFENQERAQLVQSVLGSLSPAQREVFVMVELEQLTGEEIAIELGIDVGAVRARLHRARQAFKNELLQRGLGPGVAGAG